MKKRRLMKKVLAIAMCFAMTVSSVCMTALADDAESTSDATAADSEADTEAAADEEASDALTFDSGAWLYNSSSDVYYQTGVVYCTDPYDTGYESFGIYVPAAYMNMTDNGDGTYTFVSFTDETVGNYTAETAPIVIPVNTAGYAAQSAPTGFSSGVTTYTDEGIIYLYAGCRGRDTTNGGAPWGVTDLKAAIRYYRYNASVLPGNTDSIFTFGHSGGGAQSAVVGASGDSELYYPYLYAIGAAGITYDEETDTYSSTISDATCGAMCWCPITSLDYADAAYEWMMGQYSTTGTRASGTWMKLLSDDLSEAFADYINSLTLEDEDGNVLTLTDEGDGIYTSGTYYEYLLAQIEYSLNDFIDSYTDSDGNFTYGSSSSGSTMPGGDMDGNGPDTDGSLPGTDGTTLPDTDGTAPDADGTTLPDTDGTFPDTDESTSLADGTLLDTDSVFPDLSDGDGTEESAAAGATTDDETAADATADDETANNETAADTQDGTAASDDTTTDSDALLAYLQSIDENYGTDDAWIIYDEETDWYSITSVEAFVLYGSKEASKDVGAFDSLDLSQAENYVFGNGLNAAAHFDTTMASLLAANYAEYAAADDSVSESDILEYAESYQEDIDSYTAESLLGYSSEYRQTMYNPMYYLCQDYEGYGTSNTASYWRINTGITQSDTSLTVEMNLYLALQEDVADGTVADVDFATYWEQGHTTAERAGADSDECFISWVNECMGFSSESSLLGDADLDGDIDVTDALTVLQAYVGLITPTSQQLANGDVDGDDVLTVSDALLILQYYVGIITEF